MGDVKKLLVKFTPDDPWPHTFEGRVVWTLDRLIRAGESGCTPLDQPAPRWSDYVFKLRKAGLIIETLDETHGGTYRGRHGRYVLRTPLEVVERVPA